MSQNTVAIIGLLLFVVGLPLALGAHEHFYAKKLAQPVVRFAYKGWRVLGLFWTLFQTAFGLSLVVGAGATIATLQGPLLSFLLATFILRIAWWQLPAMRLFWTYWQYDGRATLVFCREQTTATYVNQEFCLNFATQDVAELTTYSASNTRAASGDYSYTVLTFVTGSQLVVSSLLCDYCSLCALLPRAKTEAVVQRYAWLPIDYRSQLLFGSFL